MPGTTPRSSLERAVDRAPRPATAQTHATRGIADPKCTHRAIWAAGDYAAVAQVPPGRQHDPGSLELGVEAKGALQASFDAALVEPSPSPPMRTRGSGRPTG